MNPASDTLRYLDPEQAKIAGERCDGMTITAAGKALGRVQGFIVDPVARRLHYFVVRTGRIRRAMLLPVTAARVNLTDRVIELLVDEDELHPEAGRWARRLPAFSDEDFVNAIFAPQR